MEGNGTAGSPAPRIFVALKLEPAIAQRLAQLAQPLVRFTVRPVAKEDIHLTLVPPWNETVISNAIEKLRRVANKSCAFRLRFGHVGYGPDPKRPRLLWVECDAGNELIVLHSALLMEFGQREERPLLPHVTIARIRSNAAKIARKCPVDQNIDIAQEIATVELMQSPRPGERGYKVIASLPLRPSAQRF